MSMWVDKYKPSSTLELLGQSRNVARIKSWLKSFEPSRSRPLFIFGPPGIGKTTAAHLCCKETGYKTVEFNASDQRNKNIIKDVISTAASNSRLNFFGRASETKDAIILDEVDGMAGNEDRGGIAQLTLEIRNTKKPMIFICNDGQHQKLRTLKDKCETIEFKRPEYDSIRSIVYKIATKESIKFDENNLKNLVESSNYDIRQVVNSLYLFRNGSSDVVKTTRLNAFEAAKKALTASGQTIDDRFECFFADYNIMPLFMFENYVKHRPARGDQLKAISRAANSLAFSDLLEKEIRSNQNWSLLNVQALLSTVIPSKIIEAPYLGRVDFPQFLGKLSNANKRLRLKTELNAHMCLRLRGGLDPDYLSVMRDRLIGPLQKRDVDQVLNFMQHYSLLRDDFDSILELASWSFKPDVDKIDPKIKAALTLAYKKHSVQLPYFSEEKFAKKRRPNFSQDYDDEEVEEEEENEDEIIKPKRIIKSSQQKPEKPVKEKPVKEKLVKEKPVKEKSVKEKVIKEKPAIKNGVNGATIECSQPQKSDKRPADGGIARFFIAKKQKSS